MRNRAATIASLQRLADRPGTKAEGDAARAALARLKAKSLPPVKVWPVIPFDEQKFPRGTRIYYNRWAYSENDPGTIVGVKHKIEHGDTWVRIKFDRLKNARSVPVTSKAGCHISTEPLDAETAKRLYMSWWPSDAPHWDT